MRALWGVPKPRILVDCLEPFHYLHIRPLIERLHKDATVSLFFLENPGFSRATFSTDPIVVERFVSPLSVKFRSFDLTISLDYGELSWIPHRGTWLFIPHGDGMKANYTGCTELGKYDAIFALTRSQAALQRRFARTGAEIIEAGFMLGDRLLRHPCTDRVPRRFGLELGRPVVLYAPSWHARPDLIAMNEPMLGALCRQREFNVIVKPHPNLLRPERCGGKDWHKILVELQSRNVVVVDDPDTSIYEIMSAADVLLSDVSSVIYEFLFLDRPIVVHRYDRLLQAIGGQPYLNEVLSAIVQVEDPAAMLRALNEALQFPARRSQERRRILQERFFNVGSATDHAVRWIYRTVGVS